MHVVILSMSFGGNMYRSVLTRMVQTVLIQIPDFRFPPKAKGFFLILNVFAC